jgi:FixJ family two-component response regulator
MLPRAGGTGPGGNDPVSTVYIVEDEQTVRRALERLLTSADLSVCAFECVEAFMAADLETRAACVLADIDLGGTTTLDLPRRLKQAGKPLPVIFVTAWDSPEVRERVRLAGGAGYFRKPVDDQALIDAIQWAISGAQPILN